MTAQNQNPTQPQQPFYPEDEIELMDLLRVLWKWKRLIILITFVCMVIAGVAAFRMPKIYEVSMIIGPGVLGMKDDGTPIVTDLENMKGKIENGVYNTRIVKKMNLDPFKTNLKFKVINPKGTKFNRISSECESDKIANGKKILTQLAEEIAYDNEKVFQAKKEDLDKQIEAKQNEIAAIETKKKI